MRWLFFAVLTNIACSDSRDCSEPGRTTYDCQPLPAGSTGCHGGPRVTANGHGYQDDADQIFGAGCSALVPNCASLHGDLRSFECEQDPASTDAGTPTASWHEAL